MSDVESTSKEEQSRRVREMFASIATRYDLLNHLLSGNIDKRWRKLVARKLYAALPAAQAKILDVACGTGDLSNTLFEVGQTLSAGNGPEPWVIGLDFCRPMLQIAKEKADKRDIELPFIEGDALDLPFADKTFEAATIAFGLRNLSDVRAGFSEFLRILKPGGVVAVLEFSKPQTPVLSSLFRIYFTRLLPFFGGLISGSRSAYEYLPESVSLFPDQVQLASMMTEAGFERVTFQNLTGGIAAVHMGMRPKELELPGLVATGNRLQP